MSIDRARLGRKIRRARLAAGLSQNDLADKLDITQSGISGIESGKIAVGLDKLVVFADALGTTVAELLAENPDQLIAKVSGQQLRIARTLADLATLMQHLADEVEQTRLLLADALGNAPAREEA